MLKYDEVLPGLAIAWSYGGGGAIGVPRNCIIGLATLPGVCASVFIAGDIAGDMRGLTLNGLLGGSDGGRDSEPAPRGD